MSAIALGYICS